MNNVRGAGRKGRNSREGKGRIIHGVGRGNGDEGDGRDR